jgi:hypothetical protein
MDWKGPLPHTHLVVGTAASTPSPSARAMLAGDASQPPSTGRLNATTAGSDGFSVTMPFSPRTVWIESVTCLSTCVSA